LGFSASPLSSERLTLGASGPVASFFDFALGARATFACSLVGAAFGASLSPTGGAAVAESFFGARVGVVVSLAIFKLPLTRPCRPSHLCLVARRRSSAGLF